MAAGLGLGPGLGRRYRRRRHYRRRARPPLVRLSSAARLGLLPGLWAAGSDPGLLLGTRPDHGSLRQRGQLARAAAAHLPAVLIRALRTPSTRWAPAAPPGFCCAAAHRAAGRLRMWSRTADVGQQSTLR